jgi:hypothetical protein
MTAREVPRSANVVMGVLLIWTSSGRSRCPEVPVHVRKQVLSGGDKATPDPQTVAQAPLFPRVEPDSGARCKSLAS